MEIPYALPAHDPNRRETTDGMDDDETLTNGQKAEKARNHISLRYHSVDDPDKITDLIANILHLAHSLEMNPAEIMDNAATHFTAEADHLRPVRPPTAEIQAEPVPWIEQEGIMDGRFKPSRLERLSRAAVDGR